MRRVLTGLAILLSTVVGMTSASHAAGDKPFEGVTLRVSTWGGSWRAARQELTGKKLEALGAKVEYVIGNPRDNFAKLLAARGQGVVPFDVMEISPELALTLDKQGLLETLNYNALPNSNDIDKIYRTPTAVATQVIQAGIAYNKKKFDELGIAEPSSFADLFNPKLAGHVAMTDVNNIMAPYNIVALAMLGGGDEKNLDPGFKKLVELNSAYNYKASTDLATKFTLGEIWVAPWHAGWTLRIKRGGFPIAHADLKMGGKHGTLLEELMGIIKGTKAQAAAEFWINDSLSPATQIEFARKVGVVPTNAKALSQMSGDPELKDFMWKVDDQRNAFHMNWSVVEPQMPAIIEKWGRALAQ